MPKTRIEWDEVKNKSNKSKHGVSFPEAASVFVDDRAILIADPSHSDDEDRFLLLGMSAALRTLVVCHCYKESAEVIRIISARKASRKERKTYAQRWSK